MPEMQALLGVLTALEADIEAGRRRGYHFAESHDSWELAVREHPALGAWVRSAREAR